MEEFPNRHIQAVTELFDCGDRDALVSAADDVIHRRLCNAAHGAEFIDGDIPFPAELQDPLFDCFANIHWYHLMQMIPIFSCKV